MHKYRSLTKEELVLFEKEFIAYLALNGIDAPLWQKIKKEEIDKAEKIIDVFADVIFNSVLTKVNYIEHTTSKSLKFFKYNKEEAVLVGIESNELDFSNKESILQAIGDKNKKLEVYTLTKSYIKKREEEIFDMLKNGCSVSDGKYFELLSQIMDQ